MTRLKLSVLVMAFALVPGMAHAQDGFWEWLDKLSGPGPFHGAGMSWRTMCVFQSSDSNNSCFRDQNIKRMLLLRASWLSSGDNRRFDDTPGDTAPVHALLFNPIYVSRVNEMVDVGAGAGFLILTGDGFSPVARFIVTPFSVSFVPFGGTDSKWRRVLQVRFEETLTITGFDGKDSFGSTTTYSRGYEFLPTASIVLNFSGIK